MFLRIEIKNLGLLAYTHTQVWIDKYTLLDNKLRTKIKNTAIFKMVIYYFQIWNSKNRNNIKSI